MDSLDTVTLFQKLKWFMKLDAVSADIEAKEW